MALSAAAELVLELRAALEALGELPFRSRRGPSDQRGRLAQLQAARRASIAVGAGVCDRRVGSGARGAGGGAQLRNTVTARGKVLSPGAWQSE